MANTIFPKLVRKSSILFDMEFDAVSDEFGAVQLHEVDLYSPAITLPKISIPELIPASPEMYIMKPYRKYAYRNIILDMDSTLLDNVPEYPPVHGKISPIARPHLLVFMEFVFRHFDRVSIWTAAAPCWFEKCYHQVLRHCIPAGKSFDFIKTRGPHEPNIMLKPLSEVYKNFPGIYNAENTLIVDDNPATYRDNPENAIAIKPFLYNELSRTQRADLANADIELLVVIEELRCRLGT